MSALPPKADVDRHDGHVRLVPKADIRGAAKSAAIRSPRRRARAASLRADVRLLDDSPPLIHLGAQKGAKLLRRRADHNDGVPFELVSDRRLCKGCDRIVVNLSNDVPRRPSDTPSSW